MYTTEWHVSLACPPIPVHIPEKLLNSASHSFKNILSVLTGNP